MVANLISCDRGCRGGPLSLFIRFWRTWNDLRGIRLHQRREELLTVACHTSGFLGAQCRRDLGNTSRIGHALLFDARRKSAVKGESGASFRLVNARPCSGPVVPAVLGILPPPVRCSEPQRLAQLDWQCPGVCSIPCRKLKMTAASSWQSQHPTRGCVACALPPKDLHRVSSCRPLTVGSPICPAYAADKSRPGGTQTSLPPGWGNTPTEQGSWAFWGALTWRRSELSGTFGSGRLFFCTS